MTHRILRSKSITYCMKATAGYLPTIPHRFVYSIQAHKIKEPHKALTCLLCYIRHLGLRRSVLSIFVLARLILNNTECDGVLGGIPVTKPAFVGQKQGVLHLAFCSIYSLICCADCCSV